MDHPAALKIAEAQRLLDFALTRLEALPIFPDATLLDQLDAVYGLLTSASALIQTDARLTPAAGTPHVS